MQKLVTLTNTPLCFLMNNIIINTNFCDAVIEYMEVRHSLLYDGLLLVLIHNSENLKQSLLCYEDAKDRKETIEP